MFNGAAYLTSGTLFFHISPRIGSDIIYISQNSIVAETLEHIISVIQKISFLVTKATRYKNT